MIHTGVLVPLLGRWVQEKEAKDIQIPNISLSVFECMMR